MYRLGWFFLTGFLLLIGCGRNEPEPTRLQVGAHALTVQFPEDWEHVDYGDKHQFRKGMERISLEDMRGLGHNVDSGIGYALRKLREEERREIASRDTLEITGRDARLIDTWDNVSHQYPKRFLFVKNSGSMLVLYTLSGQFEAMAPVFDSLAASLAFVDTVKRTGLADGESHPQ